ncbi:hypothetical protein [Leifsonia sp. ALI-44-B]|uniref:hypothetical protein n=1 Tax=Leifsonia sp. ALI-44-B TaxID=1933776 RepID=UPI0015C32D7D|nr:hypothetical protein [Leifsonia sp. ALI-44-B]
MAAAAAAVLIRAVAFGEFKISAEIVDIITDSGSLARCFYVKSVRWSIPYRTLREQDRCRGVRPHVDDCDLAPEQLANDLLQRPDVAKPSQVVSLKHEYAFVLAGDGQRSNRPFVASESERALYGGALTYVEHASMVMPRSSVLHSSRSAYGRPVDHPLPDTEHARPLTDRRRRQNENKPEHEGHQRRRETHHDSGDAAPSATVLNRCDNPLDRTPQCHADPHQLRPHHDEHGKQQDLLLIGETGVRTHFQRPEVQAREHR